MTSLACAPAPVSRRSERGVQGHCPHRNHVVDRAGSCTLTGSRSCRPNGLSASNSPQRTSDYGEVLLPNPCCRPLPGPKAEVTEEPCTGFWNGCSSYGPRNHDRAPFGRLRARPPGVREVLRD